MYFLCLDKAQNSNCKLSYMWFFSVGENHTNLACETRTCGSRVGGVFIRAVPSCNVTG